MKQQNPSAPHPTLTTGSCTLFGRQAPKAPKPSKKERRKQRAAQPVAAKPGEKSPKVGKKLFLSVAISGTCFFEVPTIYKAYFSGLNFREYPHRIWPYMVQYLHFRILEISHWSCGDFMPPLKPGIAQSEGSFPRAVQGRAPGFCAANGDLCTHFGGWSSIHTGIYIYYMILYVYNIVYIYMYINTLSAITQHEESMIVGWPFPYAMFWPWQMWKG